MLKRRKGNGKLRRIYCLMVNKSYLLFILFSFSFVTCDIDTGSYSTRSLASNNAVKIYSGSFGYDVAYRIDGARIYSGSYGYTVAYRIDR
jgi:hypothetical protein